MILIQSFTENVIASWRTFELKINSFTGTATANEMPVLTPFSDQLRRNVANGNFYLILELSHLQAFDEILATSLLKRPADILAMVRLD